MGRHRTLGLVCLLFAATGCLLFQTATAAKEDTDDLQAAGRGTLRALKGDSSDDDGSVWTRYGGGDDDDDASKHTVGWYRSHRCKPHSYKSTKKHYRVRTYYGGDDGGYGGSDGDDKRRMLLDDHDDDGTTYSWYWPSYRYGCYVYSKRSHKVGYVRSGDDDGYGGSDGDDKRRMLLGRKYV